MKRVAIISAAGYKAVSEGIVRGNSSLFMCPEPLLPIGEQYGDTILGRQALQLARRGFTVFITVGRPGCLFPNRVTATAERFNFRVHSDCSLRSPWNWQLIDRIRRTCGSPVLVPNPDTYSYHDSFCRAIDAIGYEWDTLLMSCGDHLYTEGLLDSLVNTRLSPCQLRAGPGRELTLFWLDPSGARLYRRLADEHRAPSKHGWNGRNSTPTGWSPDGAELAKSVPLAYVENEFSDRSSGEFSRDVDSPAAYDFIIDKWLPLYG